MPAEGSTVASQNLQIPRGSEALTLRLDSEDLRVPRDLTVQCWNGQAWRPAYVITGIGDAARVWEIESGIDTSTGKVAIADPRLSIPVHPTAPPGIYRIVDTARHCAESGPSRDADFSIGFRITTS